MQSNIYFAIVLIHKYIFKTAIVYFCLVKSHHSIRFSQVSNLNDRIGWCRCNSCCSFIKDRDFQLAQGWHLFFFGIDYDDIVLWGTTEMHIRFASTERNPFQRFIHTSKRHFKPHSDPLGLVTDTSKNSVKGNQGWLYKTCWFQVPHFRCEGDRNLCLKACKDSWPVDKFYGPLHIWSRRTWRTCHVLHEI